MDELLTEFIAETRDMLQALSEEVVAWEAAPADRERLDRIFRFVHTVKGNCGFFDLPRIEALSHAAEDVLAEVRAGRRGADKPLVSAVLAVLDRIGLLIEALDSGGDVSADDDPLIAALAGAPQAQPVGPGAIETRRTLRSVRLSVELLDSLMNGVSDAVLARNELARRIRQTCVDQSVLAAFERVSTSVAEIRDAIVRTRMQRIDALFAPLPRIVRDLAGELGKEVTLELDGGDVELDREMIETIRDPLTHVIRNAVDHGIEPAAERRQAGKNAAGMLRISARQAGNQILIEVKDDGRGVDGEALARTAVAAGLVEADAAGRMSPAQKAALIFQPGLSTAAQVTAVSGRGVGMDVVRANVERIGGVVDVESRKGEGLRLLMRVPLTLTIMPALTVGAGGRTFAIPRTAIEEIVRAGSEAVRIERIGGASMLRLRGARMPLVSLCELIGGASGVDLGASTVVLLKPSPIELYALAVDTVHDHEELVVKPAAPAVMAAGIYAGTTLTDEGRPVLLLDAAGIAAAAGIDAARPADAPVAAPAVLEGEEVGLVLFRGLDGGRRAVRLALVQRIEDVEPAAIARTAGRLRVAIGDRIVALAGCGETAPAERLRILRLSDGTAELAYGFAEVIDIVSAPLDLRLAPSPGEVAGVALIGGEQVELLDPHWLFASLETARGSGRRRVCAVPAGDPWVEHMLRPLIESLGYEVVPASEARNADVLIVGEEDDEPAAGSGGEVIRLSARADGGGKGCIYRYDRAALLGALARGGKGG
jgi:two-component system chemotaxis sensor kinase CheA